MKKLILLTLLMAFIVGLPITTFAKNDAFINPSQWCTANDDLGLSSHGACVKYLMACKGPGDTGPLCGCRELLDFSPQGFYGEYNNLAECVNHLKYGYVFDE
jgi:hypothetical protein